MQPRKGLVAGATVGLALVIAPAFGAEMPEVVVEASAPVHTETTTAGSAGGAQVDLLSVKYHVHLKGLDLTKHADVMKVEESIKAAAKKGCEAIKHQYPLRSMTDDESCIAAAVKGGMAQAHDLIAAAEKSAKK